MIQVIDRALNILELLGSDPSNSFSLSEIADTVGLQKTTCANILQSLVTRDYVERCRKPSGYRLGFKAFRLVNSPEYYNSLKRISEDAMDRLFEETGETTVLAVIINGRRMVISVKECQQGITARIRHSVNLYRSATGRVILASYPESKASRLIDRIGLPDPADWDIIESRKDLELALKEIQEDNFCEVQGTDIVGLAVPIRHNGAAIASIGVCLPLFRFNPLRRDRIRKALEVAAAEMENSISGGIPVGIE